MNDAPAPESLSVESLMTVVADEFLERLDRGEQPDVEEYAGRYPQIATFIRQMFPTLQLMRAPSPELALTGDAADQARLRGCLGDFRIVREIGRGGMGVVYEAEQISLGRRVALKILRFAAALDPKQLQRFKNEAQAAAHLHHTNIVPVFGVGCERGVHYYAMQFIEGQTLAAVIAELRQQSGLEKGSTSQALSPVADDLLSGRLAPVKRAGDECPPATPSVPTERTPAPAGDTIRRAGVSTEHSINSVAYLRSVASLGIQATEALEHAHQLGIVHRDIKPANLLVDVRGHLWITDFGLAHCQSQAGLTMTGDLVGTLRYMSPEQALAKRAMIDQRTDIYSLGVTLYELLTLEPAFSGNDREKLLQQVAFEEPPPPRKRNKAIPRELETVVLKAIDKSPEGRYATAEELTDDLRRFLEYKPIRAKRPTWVQRFSKWCRRNPLLAGAMSAAAATLVLGTVVAWLLAAWAITEKGRANVEAERARESEAKALRQAYTATMGAVQAAWENHNLRRVHALLKETETFPERGFEWYYWQQLCRDKHRTLVGHLSSPTAVAFAPDGKRLATGGKDGTARIWDATSGRELLRMIGHRRQITAVAFAPDGQWLVTGSIDGTARIWNSVSGQELRTLQTQTRDPIWALAVTPDGERVVTGCEDGMARVWHAASGQVLLTLTGLPVLGASMAVLLGTPQISGSLLVASGLYPGRTGHTGPVWSVAASPDRRRLVTGSADGTARVWDAVSGRELLPPLDQSDGVSSVAVSADGQRILTVGLVMQLWDADNGRKFPFPFGSFFSTVANLACRRVPPASGGR